MTKPTYSGAFFAYTPPRRSWSPVDDVPVVDGISHSNNESNDANGAPRAMTEMHRDVQGYDLIGQVIACIADGHRYVALVVGYREGTESKEHLLYFFEDHKAKEMDLTDINWERDFSMDLTGLLSLRIVVLWPGKYEQGDVDDVILNGMIPFEAFVVGCPDGEEDNWRLFYIYGEIFEGRSLADEACEWAAVETSEWTHKGLPIVSWSSKPRNRTRVVDKSLHWDRHNV